MRGVVCRTRDIVSRPIKSRRIEMKRRLVSILILLHAAAVAQTLTVHTVEEGTGKPEKGVPVTIRYNFMEPRKALKGEVQTIVSGADGRAIFKGVRLVPGGFDVFVFSMAYQGLGPQPVFYSCDAGSSEKLGNPLCCDLLADIAIRVHRRRFSEMLQLIWPGP